jgi:hypothetical protein
MKTYHLRVLNIIMKLTQLEWIKTELKQRFYGGNEIKGTSHDYLQISGTSRGNSRDTLNSARE